MTVRAPQDPYLRGFGWFVKGLGIAAGVLVVLGLVGSGAFMSGFSTDTHHEYLGPELGKLLLGLAGGEVLVSVVVWRLLLRLGDETWTALAAGGWAAALSLPFGAGSSLLGVPGMVAGLFVPAALIVLLRRAMLRGPR